MEQFIILELKQNNEPLSMGDIERAVNFNTFKNNSFIYVHANLKNGSWCENLLIETAERMVKEGKLKRRGRSNPLNQQYTLAPKLRKSAKELALEERVAKLEELVQQLINNSK